MSSKVSTDQAGVKVYAEANWNKTSVVKGRVYENHTSGRSLWTVFELVSDWAKKMRLPTGSSVKVVKGIHKDNDGITHLTVREEGRKGLTHIPLKRADFKEDGTFVWAPNT